MLRHLIRFFEEPRKCHSTLADRHFFFFVKQMCLEQQTEIKQRHISMMAVLIQWHQLLIATGGLINHTFQRRLQPYFLLQWLIHDAFYSLTILVFFPNAQEWLVFKARRSNKNANVCLYSFTKYPRHLRSAHFEIIYVAGNTSRLICNKGES